MTVENRGCSASVINTNNNLGLNNANGLRYSTICVEAVIDSVTLVITFLYRAG